MKIKIMGIITVVLALLGFAGMANATIVDISVATDKPTYQLGEYVTISVTAYNPNPYPVTLTFPTNLDTSYLIDNIFDWAEGRTSLPVVLHATIQPYNSVTRNLTHGFYEMQDYPLTIGTHSVVGKFLAIELAENNESAPVQFEVVPEPTTITFLTIGWSVFRVLSRRRT